jgi:hypothetical protein|tara:strand:- start:241 stop:405 length:165 start_codon:yes stop_codon:yes gene_type:complete
VLRERALDLMLDAYSAWCREPNADSRQRLQVACAAYGEFYGAFAARALAPEDIN